MTAISKSFVTIADGAVDPASPLDTVLMTGLRDNAIHLREWLGASFYAGAVQDHNHDGVNSAGIKIGPNLIRNGSFEDGTQGWTFTDFTGGSHSISTATRHHGAQSASITSTVLANGGGTALSNEFIACSEAWEVLFQIIRSASGANVSSKAEVIWYDNTQAQISASTIYSDASTPTSGTMARAQVTAPANARFFKVKLTGGVPATGAATGTIFFDGINVTDWNVAQSFLKTATASGSSVQGSGVGFAYTLTGGTYSWWQYSADNPSGGPGTGGMMIGGGNVAAGSLGLYNADSGVSNIYVDERYVQASPPYNLGNGDIPLFVKALIAPDGTFRGISAAPDPVWAYNGPTSIRPERIVDGKPVRRYREINGVPLHQALKDSATLGRFLRGEVEPQLVEREITHAIKNRDMALHPHPWASGNAELLSTVTPVMLDPLSNVIERLAVIAEEQGAKQVHDLIKAGYVLIDNASVGCAAPPGVVPVACRWRLTK